MKTKHDPSIPRIPFSSIQGVHTFKEKNGSDYHVEVAPADFYILIFGVPAFTPAASFNYRNLLYRKPVVHEFKHYLPGGGKKWTSCCGMDLAFAFSAQDIMLVEHPGISYVPIEIGGIPLTLNVSGGGGGGEGWTDWVNTTNNTSVFPSAAVPKAISAFAMPPSGVPGFDPSKIEPMSDYHIPTYTRKFYQNLMLPLLAKGMTIICMDGETYSYEERSQGRRGAARQSIIARTHQLWRIKLEDIDWQRTAEANGRTEKPDTSPWFNSFIRKPARIDPIAIAQARNLFAA